MKAGVITFPGSNCDRDGLDALSQLVNGTWGTQNANGTVESIWHADTELQKLDVILVPGGFSYGDYLRSGAMAAHSPIMREVKKHADNGGYVIGICNGFQVLTETGLLDGALMRNRDLSFICKDVHLRVEQTDTVFSKCYNKDQIIRIPIAHHDGNYFADDATLKEIEDNEQVIFRYCDEHGNTNESANPNGSRSNIAGICNKNRNVIGMMPHPERMVDALTSGTDGRALFEGLLEAVA